MVFRRFFSVRREEIFNQRSGDGIKFKPYFFLFQHSMLYFFHHFELPMILQQSQLQQLIYRNHTQPQTGATPHQQQQLGENVVAMTESLNPSTSNQQQQRPADLRTQGDYISDLSRLDNLSSIARIAAVFQLRQSEPSNG